MDPDFKVTALNLTILLSKLKTHVVRKRERCIVKIDSKTKKPSKCFTVLKNKRRVVGHGGTHL